MSFKEHPEAEKAWEIIRDFSRSDVEKAHAYNDLSRYHQFKGDNQAAVQYAEKSEQMFRELHDMKNVADSIYSQGESYYSMQYYTKALDCYNKAAEIFRSEIDELYLAACLDRIADCYVGLDQKGIAVNYYRDSAKLQEAEQKWDMAGIEHLYAAEALVDMKDAEQAEFEATLAIEQYDKADETRFLARMHIVRARAFGLQQNYDAAIEDVKVALGILNYLEQEALTAYALFLYGEFLYDIDRYDEALTQSRLARKRYKAIGLASGQMKCDFLDAKIHFSLCDFEEAEKCALKVRPLASHTDTHDMTEIDWMLARISQTRDELHVVIERYEVALASLARLDKPDNFLYNMYVDFAKVMIDTPNVARVLVVLDAVPSVELLDADNVLTSHTSCSRSLPAEPIRSLPRGSRAGLRHHR